MLEKWLVSIVIGFVLRQLAKFKEQTNWETVRTDLEARVKDLVPGSWFDAEAVLLVNLVMEKLVAILGSAEVLKEILEKVAAEDWVGALSTLKGLLLGSLKTQAKAFAAVAEA
jgi:hypothetical protein